MKKLHYQTALLFIACASLLSAQDFEMPKRQIFYQEDNFQEFAYPYGELDSIYTANILESLNSEWPKARLVQAASYITRNDIRQVVSYYSALSGLRFEKHGGLFIYIFSEIDGQIASRIEIHTVPIVKIHPVFWPVRITLYHISNPITVDVDATSLTTEDEFKKRLGRLLYTSRKGNVTYRKDLSILLQEELGAQAEVYILDTEDNMSTVYRFFRRNYRGVINKSLGRFEDLSTQYFEIDATFTVGLDRDKFQLVIQVDENPLIYDGNTSSQLLKGHVLIQYIFWSL